MYYYVETTCKFNFNGSEKRKTEKFYVAIQSLVYMKKQIVTHLYTAYQKFVIIKVVLLFIQQNRI